MPTAYDASQADLAALLADVPAYRVRQVWRALNACRRPEEMTDLPAPMRAAASARRVSNVVFMGMGEPFANYDRWWTAVRRLNDDLGIAARHLTVSTVGVVPGIKRLAASDLQVNLAVSLHAANDRLRSELIPVARRYPLETLAAACEEYITKTGRRLSFEWAVIDSINDRASDVEELADYAWGLKAHVNLIPLNPTPDYPTPGSPMPRVREMRDELRERGVNATIRDNRGTSIDAACGQLAASVLKPGSEQLGPATDSSGAAPVTLGRARD